MIPHDLHHFFVGQHVFVTGASGFIGSHVASLLVKIGAHVRAFTRSTKERRDSSIDWVEGDLLRRDSIDAAMKDCRYVFHVAGDYRFWARDPREIFANNVQGTINLLEAAKRRGVEKIVCTSTTGILEPGTLDRLASEGRLASPSQFKGPYKRSKFRSYLEVKQRADAGWPIVTTLPTAPIGPHDVRPTPTGIQLLLLKAAAGLDSIRGATVTFGAIAIVLAAPVIVIVGIALYGLLGFLASFFGLIGFLGFYVERRLGTSIQVSDYNMKVRIFAQIVGFCIFAAIIIFLAVILPSLGLRLP